MLKTVLKAAAFCSPAAKFCTLVHFLVVLVLETPTLHIARIKVKTFRAPRISWKIGFDISIYPLPKILKPAPCIIEWIHVRYAWTLV